MSNVCSLWFSIRAIFVREACALFVGDTHTSLHGDTAKNVNLTMKRNYKYYAFGDVCSDVQQDMKDANWKRVSE